MIDFRYHIVSIAAVFLALAVGVVLGTTALNGPALDQVKREARNLRSDKQDLRRALEDSRSQVKEAEAFTAEITPALVAGRLAGQRVTLVAAPDAPAGLGDGLAGTLRAAGATVVSAVGLTPAYFDPARASLLDDLVARLVPPGVALPKGTPTDRAAVELAAALADRPGRAPAVTDAARTAVLAGFREAGFLTTSGAAPAPASLAVVLAPPPPRTGPGPVEQQAAQEADRRASALVSLARALDARAAGAALAGPRGSAGVHGVVARLRGDASAARAVSSVDVADTAGGRVAVVFALAGQARGQAGQYGVGAGATGFLTRPQPRA
ncbi:MAG TPA: copper transporter [Mycobacteriales bacterium]|nr:copper transporter [Mycobacteriales bacterium]